MADEQSPSKDVSRYDLVERAVMRLGLPTVLIFVGLTFFAGWWSSPVTRSEAMLQTHITQYDVRSRALLRESRRQTLLLHSMCLAVRKAEECLADVSTPFAEELEVSATPQ